MARIFEITDVPAARVDEVVKVLKDDGATSVEKKKTGETFTVVATFADDTDEKTSKTFSEFTGGG
jgi:hypothetical protein